MRLIAAGELAADDVIMDPLTGHDFTVQRVVARHNDVIAYASDGGSRMFFPHHRILLLKRATADGRSHEERTDALAHLCRTMLGCLEVDRESDGSTEFLISMATTAHALREELDRQFCLPTGCATKAAGDRPLPVVRGGPNAPARVPE